MGFSLFTNFVLSATESHTNTLETIMKNFVKLAFCILFFYSCKTKIKNNEATGISIKEEKEIIILSRKDYTNQLYGFWLGQSIANWTGLVTEMDKIGNLGEIKTGDFYTRDDWGKPDQPSIWGKGVPSDLSSTIDFVFKNSDEIWGADDDTDIELLFSTENKSDDEP